MQVASVLAALVACASAATYLDEKFEAGWEDRWSNSEAKEGLGAFVSEGGGIKTSEDAKFYALSTKFDTFSNDGKDLIIQFRVKHGQNIDCGGGYVKVFPSTVEPATMDGDSPYNIMFGPDICGPGTRKVHVIFSYKGENYLTKKSISAKTDTDSHLYTLIVKSDNTFQVNIDGEKEADGSLKEDFDMLKEKEINNPESSKPSDWVDETMVDDPEDLKPEDWVTETHITDPEAEKPEDWDDEMDGEWEAPQIDNPEFKGEWKAKRIENPEYKGVWQVKAGSIFSDVLITDSQETADAAVESFKTLAAEEAAEKKAEEEKKAAEEAAKAAETPEEPEADADADADVDAEADEEPKD